MASIQSMESVVVKEYMSTLHDLTTNNAILINVLTLLAREQNLFADAIVAAIGNRLDEAQGRAKLPTLYLIDSLIKNGGPVYLRLFQRNIVKMFCGAFLVADQETRIALYKLRCTWSALLPEEDLHRLDINVNKIDPRWPISLKRKFSGSMELTRQPAKKKKHEDLRLQDENAKPKGSAVCVRPAVGLLQSRSQNVLRSPNHRESTAPPPVALQNVHLLFDKLMEFGIISPPKTDVVSFERPETLKIKQPNIVANLYRGKQCSNCDKRFTTDEKDLYSRHLDWHCQKNRASKKAKKVPHVRSFYATKDAWVNMADDEWSSEKPMIDLPKKIREIEEPSVPMTAGSSQNPICEMCHETFDVFFHQEEDEWHIRPAIALRNKVFHPSCINDHKVQRSRETGSQKKWKNWKSQKLATLASSTEKFLDTMPYTRSA